MSVLFKQKLEADLSRRRFLKTAGISGMGVAGLMVVWGQVVTAAGAAVTDGDVLNFALNLEYLEAEFYSYATTGAGISASLFAGVGTQGTTTGGAMVSFSDANTKAVAIEIALDELNHVKFLRSALGAAAVAHPQINLAAVGNGATSQASFLELARALEDTGVTAYAGAAPLLQSKVYLQAAAQILATEAQHSGNVRKLNVDQGVTQITLDTLDIPPSTTQYFSVDDQTSSSTGLVAVRTTTQVLNIVYGGATPGGFFPNGLNGTIR